MKSENSPLLRPRRTDERAFGGSRTFLGGLCALAACGTAGLVARATGTPILPQALGKWISGPGGMLLPPAVDEPNPTRTFTLHSQCKTDFVKRAAMEGFQDGDFWFEPITAAYIVRHNFGDDGFFVKEDALKMNRAQIGDGEFGYTLTTDQVNWEWGFAFEREDGKMYYEIGKVGGAQPAPLADTNGCVQMYGAYYNRVVTYETDTDVEYVFGSCDATCPADYQDSAYLKKYTDGDIPSCPSDALSLGYTDDARLFVAYTAFLYNPSGLSGMNMPGRSIAVRDTSFAENQNQARWLVATIPADTSGNRYDRMHIVELTVNRDPNTSETTVCQSAHKVRVFDSECYSITCDASYYDIVEEAASAIAEEDVMEATASSGVVAGALEYSMLQRGDAPPRELGISFPDGQYLPGFPNKHQFLSAGEWGQDMDVRRVLLQSGSLCGSGIYSNHCVNMGKAVVDETWTATASETRYIFTVQSGPGMLKNVKVAVQKDENDDVFITAIDAGYLNRPCAASSSAADLYACDVQNAENMGANYKHSGGMPTPGGYGVGFVKYTLAPEMSPSLL